jgi:hypothetical protein
MIRIVKETIGAIIFLGFLGGVKYIFRNDKNIVSEESNLPELEHKRQHLILLTEHLERIQRDIDTLKAEYDL